MIDQFQVQLKTKRGVNLKNDTLRMQTHLN